MRRSLDVSDSFTLEDIRKIRDDKARRYTDENGKIDWDGLNAETEKGASLVRAEIACIRDKNSLAREMAAWGQEKTKSEKEVAHVPA